MNDTVYCNHISIEFSMTIDLHVPEMIILGVG